MKCRHLTSQLVHLTYRLYGSISDQELIRLTTRYTDDLEDLRQRRSLKSDHPASLNYQEYSELNTELQIRNFLRYEKLLDFAKEGPMFLRSPAAKKIVIDSWTHIAQQYGLIIYAISVMSNHVHVVLRVEDDNAKVDLDRLMEAHKRFTGNQLNQLQNARGRRVWAEGVFDRDVRPGRFTTVLWYVLNNPRKAGLTNNVLTWPGNWFNPKLEKEYIRPQRWRFEPGRSSLRERAD